MIRRPPRSTRTDTLFPYTTLFRSDIVRSVAMPPPTLSRTIGRQGNIRQTVPHGSAAMLRGSHDIETRRAAHQHFRTYFRRSEEHTSELQSLMRISYAVFCLKKKKNKQITSKVITIKRTNHTK